MADDKELKDQRVVTMMSPSELDAIDDWMFKNRIRSRGEAIRRLCHIGMEYDRISWPLLRTGMKHASAVLRAERELIRSQGAHDLPGLEAENKALTSTLAGMTAMVDLLARIGTVWITTTTMKAPDDVKEAILLAREFRKDLEKEDLTDEQKLKRVTAVLRSLGVLGSEDPPVDIASSAERTGSLE